MSPENSYELLQYVATEDGETLLDCYARVDRCARKQSQQIYHMGELFPGATDDFASFRTHAQILSRDSEELLEAIDDAVYKIIVSDNDLPMEYRLREVHPLLLNDGDLRRLSCAEALGTEASKGSIGSLDDFLEEYLITEEHEAMQELELTDEDISEDVYSMIVDEYFAHARADIPLFITSLVLGDSDYWLDGSG